MCGIFGIFNQKSSAAINKERVEASVSTMKHRGPDALISEVITPYLALGHARLSIIDIGHQSDQPFHYENLILVFNGEIFNYIELRKELLSEGYIFKTNSDTEVIPAAYLHWGMDCVKKFNGMWAFALFDKKKDLLFCSRDRFGVKPFNYTFYNGQFFFASEIKAILTYVPDLKIPNYNSISRYCRETIGAQATETWFKNILRLSPGHNLVVTRSSHELIKYYFYPKITKKKIDLHEATGAYLRIFNDSVRLRMRSDVPVGLTLSGGVDSASIACSVKEQVNQKLKAYTARFDGESFNEYDIAKRLCGILDYESIPVDVPYNDYVNELKQIIYHLESGHGSPAIFPLWHITKKAKKDITVFLEGQGADEILGGYVNSIFFDYLRDLLLQGNIPKAIYELKKHGENWPVSRSLLLSLRLGLPASMRRIYRYLNGLEQLYIGNLKEHIPFDYKAIDTRGFNSVLNRKLALMHQTGLVNLLHYGDAISMAHSMENRLPFMDYRLVEFAASMPPEFKVNGGLGKSIHRNAVKNMVPDFILNNPKKLGFVSPLKQIFSNEKSGALKFLLSDKLNDRKLFDRARVKKMIDEHAIGKVNHERILFKILSVELWFQNFIDS